MTNEDYELTLYDRIEVIKKTIAMYGEENFYLSFSGGKDSTILHHLLDIALPGNRIPRVFINTGIEYQMIVDFVKKLASKDDRFQIIKPSQNVKQMLEKYGYPFKSKQHSYNLMIYQRSGMTKSVRKYVGIEEGKNKIKCPIKLRYQFTPNGLAFKVSDECCRKMKKEPVKKWEKENNKHIAITGMRKGEGGERLSIKGCIITDRNGKVAKFHPLLVVSDEWEEWYTQREKIELCKLYYPPYNFKRTGCRFCPFNLELEQQLKAAYELLPNEARMGEMIWKPVFDEYRRVNYRLKKAEQMKLDL